MRVNCAGIFAAISFQFWQVSAVYVPLHEYAGATFFDGWDYWGNVDNTTWGNVTYVDQANATAHRLTYVNAAGNAIIKVDNTTTIAPAPLVNRESVRLTSKASYGVGTLWIVDAVHLPYGCSVWPSFWTLGTGKEWPNAGEIDIIESINLKDNNQMALHSTPGCFQAQNPAQSGQTLERDCSLDRGCIVAEKKPNSYGQGFAQAGGGVYAVQMDISGVYMWFWSRPDIPDSIKTATSTSNMDITTFGMPSASYPASGCNITQYFGPQQLVLLITLCGVWAGVPDIYASTCPGNCVRDNVIGPGSPKFDTAYFEIPYIRTYIADTLASSLEPSSSSTPSLSSTNAPSTSTTTIVATSGAPVQAGEGGKSPSSAARTWDAGAVMAILSGVVAFSLWVRP